MAHGEKIKGDGAQLGARCKKGGSGEGKYAVAMERTGTGIRSNGHHVMTAQQQTGICLERLEHH